MVSSDILRGMLTGTQYKQACALPVALQCQIRAKAKTLPRDKVRALVERILAKVNGIPLPESNTTDKGKEKIRVEPPVPVSVEGPPVATSEPSVEGSSGPEPKRKPAWKPLRPKKIRKPEPLHCENRACNWATDHRPRNFDRVVGNKGAKDKLREWMRQREDLKAYINARRGVRLPKYKSAIAGETTGDKAFDGKPVPTVALLHGPPGVGKTTLAQLFMAMYKLKYEEVNASDINTEDKLISVLQRTVYAPNTGLILDEFDGIFQGSDTPEGAEKGVPKLLECLGGLNVLTGPVVVIVNDVTKSHVKALKSKPTCLDVRLYPVDKKDLYAVLTDMLRRHNQSIKGGVQSRLIADCDGDVRMMLNSTQFTLVGNRATSVVVGGNDAESDHLFTATAGLLSGKGSLHTSTLYGDPSLLSSLAFHNYLPASVKASSALDVLSAQVDALSVLDSRGWRANSFAMDVVDQTFKAYPQANVVNTFKSRVQPTEHNVEWPVGTLLKRAATTGVPTWLTNPTLPHDAQEAHPWIQIMSGHVDDLQAGSVKAQLIETLLEQDAAPECYGRVHGSGRQCALKKKR